jgi:membrane protein implicated in regulation of membrane protease activity
MEYFTQHQDYFFYALAGICLLVELSLLGMSGPLLFLAIGSVITGALISLGIIHSFGIALVALGSVSLASAALLWTPLKKLQNKEIGPEISSDMVGKVVPVTARITQADGRVSYSGVEWLARLDSSSHEPVETENRVQVTSVDGTILVVKAV